MMPLLMAALGEEKKIIRVGGKEEVRRYLAALGFVEGEAISVVNEFAGNLIVNVKDSRVALSKALAGKIYI